MKLTLYKYIFNEIWPTFFACLFVSVFAIIAGQMVQVTELVINREVFFGHVIRMIVYMLPDIVGFVLPAASLMAVLVAFLRLSADNEIIALKSSGISLYQLLAPVVVLSFTGLLVSSLIVTFAAPWGNRSFKDLLFQIGQSKADLGVKERIFSEPFEHVVFYVNSFSSRSKVMRDVFVVDRRDKKVTNTIIAEKARIVSHPQHSIITLRFEKGDILVVDKRAKSARSIKFDTYDLNIGLKDIMASLSERRKRPKELYMSELKKEMKKRSKGTPRYNEMMTELWETFSIPIAVFLMGIIGVPLGAQLREGGRSFGIGVSLIVFSIYYLCLAGTKSICETGIISPIFGVWIPVLFLLFSCVYLLRISAMERFIPFLSKHYWKDLINTAILTLKRKLRK
jgi:lipopolysaccharide export system permease protein